MPKKYIIILSLFLIALLALTLVLAFALKAEDKALLPISSEKVANDRFCLLVLGKDRASGLCDVMMLVSIDPEQNAISVMQIPRDTYADYGNRYHKKLNTALKLLGAEEALCEFLSKNLGVAIDGYLTLELDAFRKAVDALGGVRMYLPSRLYYSDPEQGLYIDLPAGEQLLDGEAAEKVVRYRKGYAGGDIDRLDVQKRFLAALFRTVREKVDASNIYGLLREIFPHVSTNVGLPLAVALGIKALDVEPDSLCLMTLPGEAVVGDSGASFYALAKAPAREMIEVYFKESGELDPDLVFCNSKNERFVAIYEKQTEFSISHGNEFE